MVKRMIRRLFVRMLRRRGYSAYFAPRVFDAVVHDLCHTTGISLRHKLWAYRRGFLGASAVMYRLNNQNVGRYLPDLHYCRLHPLNGRYSHWIDDKLTLRYLLAPFAAYLPKYYFELQKDRVFTLPDCPAGYTSDISGVISLLQNEKSLAMKPSTGTGGIGFHKLSAANGRYSVNNNQIGVDQLFELLSCSRDHLVTEYITSHHDLRKIYGGSANTVRIIAARDEEQGVQILGAFCRFGTSVSKAVDNVLCGGIFCDLRTEDGVFFNPRQFGEGGVVESTEHPDTGAKITGVIPFWDTIKQKVQEICDYIPQMAFMGYDIVVTDTGFKILEINSLPTLQLLQQHYPLMDNSCAADFFRRMCATRGIPLR